MEDILDYFFPNAVNDSSFIQIAKNLKNYVHSDDIDSATFDEYLQNFVATVYVNNYTSNNSKKKYDKIKRNKYNSKKREWYSKAIEGYETYKETEKIQNGFYSHFASKYKEIMDKEREMGKAAFQIEYNSTPEEVLDNLFNLLKNWGENDESLLSSYPFFYKLSTIQQRSTFEIDLALFLGKWLVENEELYYKGMLSKEPIIQEDGKEHVSHSKFVRQAPYETFEHPWFGIAKKATYPVEPNNTDIEGRTILLKPKSKFEMQDAKYNMGYKTTSKFIANKKTQNITHKNQSITTPEDIEFDLTEVNLLEYKKSVSTLDMNDYKLYIDLVNRRGNNFSEEKKIYVPLLDLVKSNSSQGPSKSGYREIITRLTKLAHFELSYTDTNGTYVYKKLLSSLVIGKNELTNQLFVEIHFSESVYDNIIKQQCINVYDKELLEIDELAYHLVFLIQKKRIYNFKKKKLDFPLEWSDFTSFRLNKGSKKNNIQELTKALNEIKDKKFLIKNFKILSSGFYLFCYPLNEREIEDVNNLKLDIPNNQNEINKPILI